MKHLIQKVCIASGLLVTLNGFSQATATQELSLKNDGSFQHNTWQNDVKGNFSDSDLMHNKTYGEPDGIYSIVLPALGATAVNKESKPIEWVNCIYAPDNSTSFPGYDIQLQIPSGHKILGMLYGYKDSSASHSKVELYSIDNSGNLTVEHNVTSFGDTGIYDFNYKAITGGLIVDNGSYKYGIRFLPAERGSNQQMCGVYIEIDSTP